MIEEAPSNRRIQIGGGAFETQETRHYEERRSRVGAVLGEALETYDKEVLGPKQIVWQELMDSLANSRPQVEHDGSSVSATWSFIRSYADHIPEVLEISTRIFAAHDEFPELHAAIIAHEDDPQPELFTRLTENITEAAEEIKVKAGGLHNTLERQSPFEARALSLIGLFKEAKQNKEAKDESERNTDELHENMELWNITEPGEVSKYIVEYLSGNESYDGAYARMNTHLQELNELLREPGTIPVFTDDFAASYLYSEWVVRQGKSERELPYWVVASLHLSYDYEG